MSATSTLEIHSARLKLTLQTLGEVRASIARLAPEEKAELSPVWLAKALSASEPDPWMHGYNVVLRDGGVVVGLAGFKGPPSDDGVVEIAYGINAEHQGRGYATEAAEALTQYAFRSGRVRLVLAHTLPQPNASTRVLTKCGFHHVGEVVDPEDGLVWRWERVIAAE